MATLKTAVALHVLAAWICFTSGRAAWAADAPATEAKANVLSAEEEAAGWKLLFDGKSLDGWHTFKMKEARPGWQVKDGTLACVDPHQAGDLCTNQQYGWFELQLDYNISPGGNSGIMYRVTDKGGAAWATGPEFQLEDNEKAKDKIRCGWLYAALRAAGRSQDRQAAGRHQTRRGMEPRPPAHLAGKVRARDQRREILRIRAGQRRLQGSRRQKQVREDAGLRQS